MTSTISADGLTKVFGDVRALDGLNFTVSAGAVHGLLGPNGAGKSTTIRILLGLLKRDDGHVSVLGGDPWHDAVRLHRQVAYVPGDVSLWPNLSGGEAIDLFGRLRGRVDRNRRERLLESFDLDPTKKCSTYSKGNRQKVAIVSALAADAELFIFDEPTSGLDPLMETVFRHQVNDLKRQGKTILLSSHILAEVEALCDRVSIMRAGRIVESGTLAELRHLTRTTITAETDNPVVGLDGIAGVHNLVVSGLTMKCQVDSSALDETLRHVIDSGVRSLTSMPPTLEELFLRHYGDELAVLNGVAHGESAQ